MGNAEYSVRTDPTVTTWDERMASRRQAKPKLELLERCWRLRTFTGQVLACGIFRTAAGLEVRAGYEPADFLYSRTAAEIGHARDIAAAYKTAMTTELGSVTELPLG